MKTPEELAEEFWNEWADKKFRGSSHEEVVTKAALWLIRQRDAEVLKAIEEIYYNTDWEATELQQPELWIMQLKQRLGLE